MTEPRSSFVMALREYKGPRPGLALTVAATLLIGALITGLVLIAMLSRFGTAITDGQQTLRALQGYTIALQDWWELAIRSEVDQLTPESVARRDSIGVALRVNLRELQTGLSDSLDRSLTAAVLEDIRRPGAGEDARRPDMGERGREAMVTLIARQDSALTDGVAQLQRAQMVTAMLLSLTVLASVALIAPLSWMYVRYKQRVPAGL